MTEDSGTRSSLLWHVGRLLDECEQLPQVLLMENVTQVHGKKNMDDFQKWLNRLEWMGYKNYWHDLNAKDYGVAQNRNRCFCVSILGDNRSYEFPKPIPLKKTMQDYLEEEVSEEYYVNSDRAKQLLEKLEADNILDRPTDRATIDFTYNEPKQIEVANCISRRTDRGVSARRSEGSGVCEYES